MSITHRCHPEGECFCFYDPECNPEAKSMRLIPAEITDEMVDAAVRAFNGWPADHPMDEYHRRDVRWIGIQRALDAALRGTA